jgi:hypothetical protein
VEVFAGEGKHRYEFTLAAEGGSCFARMSHLSRRDRGAMD